MTIIFDNVKASRAIKCFEELCKNDKELLDHSAKGLITATVMAYHGHFTSDLVRSVVGEYADLQAHMVKVGLLSIDKSTMPYTYIFNHDVLGVKSDEKNVSDDIAFLFTNALFNVKEYTQKYGIKSWNTIGLVLETTLKTGYSNQYISLTPEEIYSVSGKAFNKTTVRKNLVDLGFIQERKSVKRSQQYRLNKRAYLLGANT